VYNKRYIIITKNKQQKYAIKILISPFVYDTEYVSPRTWPRKLKSWPWSEAWDWT